MGLSSVVVEQREKETKALKSFLLYSSIVSLVLHIGILALGISKFLQKVSATTEKPIEITIIETVPTTVTKPQETKKSPLKINSGGSSGGGNNNAQSAISAETTISVSKAYITPVVKQTQLKTTYNFVVKKSQTRTIPEPKITPQISETNTIEKTIPEPKITPQISETNPIEKLRNKLDNSAITQTRLDQTVIPNTKPSDIKTSKSTTPISISSKNIPGTSLNENTLGNLGNRLQNTLSKGTGSGTESGVNQGTGSGTESDVNKGTGSGTGNKIENQPKKEDITVATAPKPHQKNGSKLNRADCIKCDIKYPDRARRRGIEGNAEVAIDIDANGNVTFVRLIRSSGDNELDEAAQQAAQEWKLKPTDVGRQGVRASVNFAIKGSQHHRKLQERQRERQRETAQKKPETDASSENTTKPTKKYTSPDSQPLSPIPAPPVPEPVKSDTNNQADESRHEGVAAPSSTTPPESNSDSANSN